MSVYNTNILTRIHDPVYDSKNFKTEFRLQATDAVYLSNMRLINVGIDSVGVDNLSNGPTGNFPFESIQLYDGNVMLDQVLKASIWRTFKNINKTNDENSSIQCILDQTSLGYVCAGSQKYNPADNNYEKSSVVVDEANNRVDTEKLFNKAYINLREVLPFLESSLYLPTRTFKNLRLVLNYSTALKNLVRDRTAVESTFLESSLITDELVGPMKESVAREYKGVQWKAIENDSVHVSAMTPANTEEQSNKFLVNGFNNKTVNRMVVVQTPLNQITWINGNETLFGGDRISMSQLDNTFQFRINGANKLPRDGFTKKNQRLAQLTEAWGEFNLVPMSNFVYAPQINTMVEAFVDTSMGKVDYTGVEINERVNEFQLFYNRKGVDHTNPANSRINQALQLNLFGEVNKSLEVDGANSYTIKYT